MKILFFKFNQNRAINEKFDFWGDQIFSGKEEKFEKASYRTVVLTHTENFSILFGGTEPTFVGFWTPQGVGGVSDFKNSKKPHAERWSEHTAKISAP